MNRFYRRTSRRAFLRTAAAGAGISSAALACTTEKPAQEKQALTVPEPLGIALVGLGYYATDVLAPALQQTKNVRLNGIVTGTPSKIPVWQSRYGIPEANVYDYETFDRLSENPDIDIIYVVLPNSMHAEYTIRAARAGKHVICEKPMALDADECRAMIDACSDAGVALSIGYRMHFEPHTQEIMRMGREKVFGQVKMISAGAGYRESRADHWKLDKDMGGGAMMDMGVYCVQGARYVLGEEPVRVSAQTFTSRPDMFTEVDETTTLQLEFPSGAVANLHTSFANPMSMLHADAQSGWFRLHPFQTYDGIAGDSSNGPISFPEINQQAAQMDEVAWCITEDRPMRVPGEEGLADMRVVDAVSRSIAAGGAAVGL